MNEQNGTDSTIIAYSHFVSTQTSNDEHNSVQTLLVEECEKTTIDPAKEQLAVKEIFEDIYSLPTILSEELRSNDQSEPTEPSERVEQCHTPESAAIEKSIEFFEDLWPLEAAVDPRSCMGSTLTETFEQTKSTLLLDDESHPSETKDHVIIQMEIPAEKNIDTPLATESLK